MLNEFIDIFFCESDKVTPYQAILWRDGRIAERVSHRRLTHLIDFCRQRKLPVIASDERMRIQLSSYGIPVQAPFSRALGAD
jgi:predicted RNase H-like nuclease (RuvC/YqgF family)